MLLALALLALVGFAASGCGQSEKDKYADDYKSLNDRLLRIGVSVGAAPLEAEDRTSAEVVRRFSKNATDLERVKKDIVELDTPGELEDESLALTSSIQAVVVDLRKVSAAAKRGDKDGVTAATRELATNSAKVNFAQNKLAEATGADIGPR